MVEIYHSFGYRVTIDVLLKDGLKSRRRLVSEGKLKPITSRCLPDQMDVIYFRQLDPSFAKGLSTPWISLEVPENDHFVFNAEFRADSDAANYYASKIHLPEFIEKRKRGEALRGSKPGILVYDPITAESTFVDINDPRASDRHWLYHNEVLIQRDLIPPEEFHAHHSGK